MSSRATSPAEVLSEDVFERPEEVAALATGVLINRKSMLLFGEMGAGKTRLLHSLAAGREDVVYMVLSSSAREFLTGLIKGMHGGELPTKLQARVKAASLPGLKGLVLGLLREKSWTLFLDQVQSPSNSMSRLIKDLNYFERTPVLMAARSEHMEDIGGLRSLCYNRTSRVELKPFSSATAVAFTRHYGERLGLEATNLDEALKAISEMSRGYPGRILQMLHMARAAAYRFDDCIKYRLIYVDYSMTGGLRAPDKALI